MVTQTSNLPNANGSSETLFDIRAFAKSTLKNRVFLGNFQEKRYVPKLNTYKDVIVLDKNEKILCDDFVSVRNRIQNCDPNIWVGFSAPTDGVPSAFCIWTTLAEENPSRREALNMSATDPSIVFGEYWFQVETLYFGTNTVEIQLKILRPVDSIANSSSSSSVSFAQQALEFDPSTIQRYVEDNIINVDWSGLLNRWKVSLNQTTYRFASEQINFSNFIRCIGLIGAFCIGSVNAIIQFIHFLGEFTLKLTFELTRLVRSITPIVLALLNLIGKVVGGFYILLAMIWRDLFGGGDPQRRGSSIRPINTGYRTTTPSSYRSPYRPIQMIRPSTEQSYRYQRL